MHNIFNTDTTWQKWGVVYLLKSWWDFKSEISSLHCNDFTLVNVISLQGQYVNHVSILVNIIHYYNLLW
jgi:hypothetical protein